jgi:hypothetical protein
MYALHCTDYHKTYSCSAALRRRILYWISPKSVKAYAKHGRNPLTPLGKVWLPTAIFTKPTLVQLSVMNSYTELHKNPINGLVADTVTNDQTFFFYCLKHRGSWKQGSENIWPKKEEVEGRWNICIMRSWIICSPRQTYEQIKKIRNTCSMHGIRKQKTVVTKPQRDLDVERRKVLKLISCK